MYPSALFRRSSYVLSICTIQQFNDKLFSRSKSLLPKFSCLVKQNQSPHDLKTQKTLNSLVLHNHLPGYMYSMSDQCRFISNDSTAYSCRSSYLNGQCHKLSCNVNGHCSYIDELLDGTSCGHGHVCLFSECVKIENIENGYDQTKTQLLNIPTSKLTNLDILKFLLI